MREILRGVLARRVDFMKSHWAEEPTILKIDKAAHEKLRAELMDFFGEWTDLMGCPDSFQGQPLHMVYGLRLVVVDDPEWLEVV